MGTPVLMAGQAGNPALRVSPRSAQRQAAVASARVSIFSAEYLEPSVRIKPRRRAGLSVNAVLMVIDPANESCRHSADTEGNGLGFNADLARDFKPGTRD
jgi:hypothetical protein